MNSTLSSFHFTPLTFCLLTSVLTYQHIFCGSMLDSGKRPLAKLPEWVPPGWAMEVRERSSGLKDKYYIEPIYGHRFRSKKDVFRYLGSHGVVTKKANVSSPAHLGEDVEVLKKKPSVTSEHLGGDVEDSINEGSVGSLVLVAQDIVDVGKSIDWLPSDWKVELRQRKGKFTVEYYIDPTDKYKFRSKREVFCHLGLAIEKSTSASIAQDISATVEEAPNLVFSDWRVETKERKNGSEAKEKGCGHLPQHVLKDNLRRKRGRPIRAETTPNWLPLAWSVEVKPKKDGKKYKVYVDPVSGKKFYTKWQVLHYLENGVRMSTKKRGGENAESVCPEISLYNKGRTQKLDYSSTRRCLFTGQSSNTSETKNDEFECKSALKATPLSFRDSECKQNNMVCVDNGYSVRKHRKRKSEPELYEPRICKNLSLPHRTSRRLAGLPPESAPETTEDDDTPAVVAVAETHTGEVEHYLGRENQSNKVNEASKKAEVEIVEVEHCIVIEDRSNQLGRDEVYTGEVEHSHVTEDQSNKVRKAFEEAEVETGEVEHCIVIEDQTNNAGKRFVEAVVENSEVQHCIVAEDQSNVGKSSVEALVENLEVEHCNAIRGQSNKLGKDEVKTAEVEHSLVIEEQLNNFRKTSKKAEVEQCITIEEETTRLRKGEVETGQDELSLIVEDQTIKVGKASKEAVVEIQESKHCTGDQSNKNRKAEVDTGKDEHLLVIEEEQSNNVGKAFEEAKLETREVEHKHGKAKLETGEVEDSIAIEDQSNKVGKSLEDQQEHMGKKLATEVPGGSKVFFSFGGVPLFDPCIEFAFKTLTGAIPVEDNLHQRRSSASRPSISRIGLPDVNTKRLL